MRVIRASDLELTDRPQQDAVARLRDNARVCIAGIAFELRTNVPGLAPAFALRYSDHAASDAPQFFYYVYATGDGYVFWCDHDRAFRWHGTLPVDAILFLADAAAVSALVHFDASLVSMHGAGIAYNGAAAGILADSEGGKTTTAIACARAGMQVYSDERILLRGQLVQPFLRRCRVREGGAALLRLDVHRELSWSESFGDAVLAQPQPLRHLFVIGGRSATPRVQPLPLNDALRAAGRWFDCAGTSLERTARTLQAVRSARCLSLTLGTPEETARCIRSVLARDAAA
jgi:hypothetical protein